MDQIDFVVFVHYLGISDTVESNNNVVTIVCAVVGPFSISF